MKIVVYAICKNEAQFVSRWIKSMSEADQIVVLDTGSTDDTVQRLRTLGAQVTVETICPWRFDELGPRMPSGWTLRTMFSNFQFTRSSEE